jgi:two-component SAPR family response regulator
MRLASGSNDEDKLRAVEMYKTDFVKDSYRNWAEDVRENLKFVYSDTIHKLITFYEDSGDSGKVIMLLEKLLELDFSDEEIMMKLLSLYNKEKDFRKFRFAYGLYERRLKKEFNVQPSSQLKDFFNEVTTQG